jgi:hypothetical protein
MLAAAVGALRQQREDASGCRQEQRGNASACGRQLGQRKREPHMVATWRVRNMTDYPTGRRGNEDKAGTGLD